MKKPFIKLFKEEQISNLWIRAKEVSKQNYPPLTPQSTKNHHEN